MRGTAANRASNAHYPLSVAACSWRSIRTQRGVDHDDRSIAAGPGGRQSLAYGVRPFAKAVGVGADAVYDAIREGRLKARKVGTRTLILHDDGMDWLRSLPTIPAKSAA